MPAVVVRQPGICGIESLTLRPLGRHDVLVRIEASGICHSDVSVLTGDLPAQLPVVLGHEGAGTVVEAGAGVSGIAVGDRVVLAAIGTCGRCYFCSRGETTLCEVARAKRTPPFLSGNQTVGGVSGLGTLTDMVVVDEGVAVRVDSSLPAAHLAMIGCAVLTGTGAALNLAALRPGSNLLVIGAGGVGLAAVQGARTLATWPLAVIDSSPDALAAATASGASHAFAPGSDSEGELLELTHGRGFDSVIDCVGNAATMQTAWNLARRGGTIVMVGVARRGEFCPIPIADLATAGKRVVGCVYGASSIHRDITRYAQMAERGELDFGVLLGRTISLADAPSALLRRQPLPGRTVVVNP
jgi:S-(hydroxymethyl)glutathione dehydrogenase / alcohol dehydrogenase